MVNAAPNSMAQNAYQNAQLSFPELIELHPVEAPAHADPATPATPLIGSGSEAVGEMVSDIGGNMGDEPVAASPRPAKSFRKRNSKPRIVLVKDDEPEAIPANAEAVLPAALETAGTVMANPGPGPLAKLAQYAPLAATVIVSMVFVLGGWQFVETQRAQRESLALQNLAVHQSNEIAQADINSKAVDLFMRYNELMLQVAAPVPKGVKRETRYWKENLAISLLESLSNLTRGRAEWEQTILWALDRHLRFIREQRLACNGYSPDFIHVLERASGVKAVSFCRG